MSDDERLAEAVELLFRLASDEDCDYDHDDLCQTHYYQRPCAHKEARAFLDDQKEAT